MAKKPIGVEARFETRQFTAGLNRYLTGIQNAIDKTRAFAAATDKLANQMTLVNQALNLFAKNAAKPAAAIAQASTAINKAVGNINLSPLQNEIRYLKLLQQELRGVADTRRAAAKIGARTTTDFGRREAQIVIDLNKKLAEQRREQAQSMGFDTSDLDAIAATQIKLIDLGNRTVTPIREQLQLYNLIQAEMQDVQREQQLVRQIAAGTGTAFEKQNRSIEHQVILMRRLQRQRTASDLGIDPKVLKQYAKADTTDVAKDRLEANQLINAEIEDRIKLTKIQHDVSSGNLQVLERQKKVIEAQAIGLRRQQRTGRAKELGIDLAKLQEIRRAEYKIVEPLQRQLQVQQFIGQEMADRLEEERQMAVLASKTATQFQRQQAALALQGVGTRRRIRDQKAIGLGISQSDIKKVRSAEVALDDLGDSGTATAQKLDRVSTATIAMGVAIGQVAVQAARALFNSLRRITRSLGDLIMFFERLEISVEFYAARSFMAKDATLDFSAALKAATFEAQGLLIWLQRLAVASPFTTRDVGVLFRTAQAYGLTRKEAELFTPLLLDFAAAAGLNEEILERLALAIGQIRARGKLTGEEIRQLGNSGIPIRDILVKQLGIANNEFDKFLERGRLTSDIVLPAIIKQLEQFEGMGKVVAFETLTGIIQAFKELQQIGIARFFKGAVIPVRAFFNEVFDLANDPKFLAWAQIIGQDAGKLVLKTFEGIRDAVIGVTQAFKRLDPMMKGQIVTFIAAAVGIALLSASVGLLFIATQLLLQPFVALTLLSALFISEWGQGFKHINIDMARFTKGFSKSTKLIRTNFIAMLGNITEGFSAFATGAGGMLVDLANWGTESAIAFADGWNRGLLSVAQGIVNLSNLFAFWLKPGSDSEAIPAQTYGRGTMDSFWTGVIEGADNNPKSRFLHQVLRREALSQSMAYLGVLDRIASKAFGSGVVDNWTRNLRTGAAQFRKEIVAVAEEVLDVEEQAQVKGYEAARAWVSGFLLLLPTIAPQISAELAKVLGKIGGGAQLGKADAGLLDPILKSFKKPDFSAFSDLTSFIQREFQNLIKLGEMDEIDLPRKIFGARIDLAKAIKEIRNLGNVTESTMNRIRSSAGSAGGRIVELIQHYTEIASATNAAEAAQETINAVTEKYKKIIEPIKKILEGISDARKTYSDDRQILNLQRTIANEAVSAAGKREAELGIQEILQKRKVRELEKERNAKLDVAEADLDSAEKRQDEAKTSAELLRNRLDEGQEQLGLVGDELALLERLNKEADNLRKKQKTQLDLQLEYQKLLSEETADTLKAAKAKYVLEQAGSSELEKQRATQDLIAVALNRQKRDLTAIELGVGLEQINALRDLPIVFDDLGVSVGGVADSADDAAKSIDELYDTIVPAKEIAEEWAGLLAQVHTQWQAIKLDISEVAHAIDAALPSFLKIFPEEPGDEPPIISWLKEYGDAIFYFMGILAATKAIKGIHSLTTALAGLLGVNIAGAASGAGGVTLKTVGFANLIVQLGNLGTKIAIFGGIAAAAAISVAGFAISIKNLFDAGIGKSTIKFGTGLFGKVSGEQQLSELSGKQTKKLADVLKTDIDTIDAEITEYIKQKGTDANVAQFMNEKIPEFVRGLDTTLIEELSGLKGYMALYRRNLIEAVGEENIPTAEIEKSGEQIGKILDTGIGIGLQSDEGGVKATLKSWLDDFVSWFKAPDLLDAQSPSKYIAKILGIPIAEGLVEPLKNLANNINSDEVKSGILSIFTGLEKEMVALGKSMKNGIVGQWIELTIKTRVKLNTWKRLVENKFGYTFEQVLIAASRFNTNMEMSFIALALLITNKHNSFHINYLLLWNTTKIDTITKVEEIKTGVILLFAAMRTGVVAEINLLKTAIIGRFVDDKDSILKTLRKKFIGSGVEGETSPSQEIGKDWIEGVAQGITDNKETLADAMITAITYAFTEATKIEEAESPSKRAAREIGLPWAQGVAMGIQQGLGGITDSVGNAIALGFGREITQRFASLPSQQFPGNVSNVSRTTNLNLSVNSSQTSQGIINDFTIMNILAAT